MPCPHCGIALPPDARFCAGCGKELSGLPPRRGLASTSRVRLLIVLGVALAVLLNVAIVAAVAVPNFLNAIDRGKQKRTLADMQTIGAAIEAYRAERGAYPIAGDVESLRLEIEPTYVRALPVTDGWGRPFHVRSDGTTWTVASGGKDGTVESCDQGPTMTFDAAICLEPGGLTQWPESPLP
jgi:general secretion pathway protein G